MRCGIVGCARLWPVVLSHRPTRNFGGSIKIAENILPPVGPCLPVNRKFDFGFHSCWCILSGYNSSQVRWETRIGDARIRAGPKDTIH
eukprot:6205889-Pleurochrysis_carterae.AAC.1